MRREIESGKYQVSKERVEHGKNIKLLFHRLHLRMMSSLISCITAALEYSSSVANLEKISSIWNRIELYVG